MTAVIDAPPDAADVTPTAAPERAHRDDARAWTRHAHVLLVAFAVLFTAWFLRDNLRGAVYPNDAGAHEALVRFAASRIRAGQNPFDAWFPFLGLGSPQYTQYQTLSHIFTALLSVVLGGWVFRAETYALVCTLPVSVYIGARLLGLDRWQAAAAAFFAPMLANVTGYGIEWSSFVWGGPGLWSMLWGIWLLPIALGLAWRAVAKGERIALAAFVVGLTCALHFMTGYLVLFAFIVFVLCRPPEFVARLGRSAIVGLGGLAIFAFVFVPALRGLPYVNVNAFQVGTHWFDSYGPAKVMRWLVRGEVFDYGRLPVVSLLVLAGAVVALTRARRDEAARVPLGLMVLSLLLYSGRRVVGPVVNYLPGGGSLFLHRYIMGVHFAGLLLAGIGSVWLVRSSVTMIRRFRSPRRVMVVTGACAVAVVVALTPVILNRVDLAHWNGVLIGEQSTKHAAGDRDIDALVDIVKQRGDGRVYAGPSSGWGDVVREGSVSLYMFPVQHDTDSLGLLSRTDSLSADVEPYFDDSKPAEYDLFNVKYLLLPAKLKPKASTATLLAQRGRYSLYEVPTSGYLEAVDTTAAVAADRDNMYAMARPYVKSSAVAEYRHPFVSFNGRATPVPSIAATAPYVGAPGTVTTSAAQFVAGRFRGTVRMARPAWVMLKESYSPHWTATVDGKRVPTAMLAPSFVGVPVPAGAHQVSFQYESGSSYPVLFLIGALTLLALVVVPWQWRRRATRRP